MEGVYILTAFVYTPSHLFRGPIYFAFGPIYFVGGPIYFIPVTFVQPCLLVGCLLSFGCVVRTSAYQMRQRRKKTRTKLCENQRVPLFLVDRCQQYNRYRPSLSFAVTMDCT